MDSSNLIDALAHTLRQELAVLDLLDEESYTSPGKGFYSSSIGSQMRHNLDHFSALFRGLESGRVDYENRQRDNRIEQSKQFAANVINKFLERIERLDSDMETPLRIREEDGAPLESCKWMHSTLGREVQFLLGHTVHHHAIIALMLNRTDLPEGFGTAPSTQRHEQVTNHS